MSSGQIRSPASRARRPWAPLRVVLVSESGSLVEPVPEFQQRRQVVVEGGGQGGGVGWADSFEIDECGGLGGAGDRVGQSAGCLDGAAWPSPTGRRRAGRRGVGTWSGQ